MKTCKRCGDQFPSWEIIDGKKKVYSSRLYCFSCSPFGQHRIGGSHQHPVYNSCDICGKPLQPNRANRSCCNPCHVKLHRIANKVRAVQLLGGRCKRCGWTGNFVTQLAAFEFHHYGSDKAFTVGNALNKKWDSIVTEIKKCELLCSNCHRIHHSRREARLVTEAMKRIKTGWVTEKD